MLNSNIYSSFCSITCVCVCYSWTSWRTGMQSVWRCSMSPRRRSESSAIKTPLLPGCEGTSPTASTPWWEKHTLEFCVAATRREQESRKMLHVTKGTKCTKNVDKKLRLQCRFMYSTNIFNLIFSSSNLLVCLCVCVYRILWRQRSRAPWEESWV